MAARAKVKPLRPPGRRPDPALAADAVERFLDALGLPPEVRHGDELAGTPRRVAEAWIEDLVDGYGRDPAEVERVVRSEEHTSELQSHVG